MRRGLACLVIAALALSCAKPRERERGEGHAIENQDRRDREQLTSALDVEIESLDKQIRALDTQEEGRAERDRLWDRREVLFGDREAVQTATEADWRVVKERAERDLRYVAPGRI